ncbi:hypothetical protein AVEN_27117-1 [Araneus ventricosus]|uniref:Uncharacterized protein n=1 Tax=Araneus ventricosus TaxID=182803 RepID=A0A4Y2WIH2_ARAVE|nr:hypothetical protein AVEN_27117-1 [Araneus ventricosus]
MFTSELSSDCSVLSEHIAGPSISTPKFPCPPLEEISSQDASKNAVPISAAFMAFRVSVSSVGSTDFLLFLPIQGSLIFGFQRHRPPRDPTREGSCRLWALPASVPTLVLARTYTLRATSRSVDHP